MTEDTVISVVVWKEQAKQIEKELGLKMVGDVTDINTKVKFEKLSAEGRSKILITIYLS